MPKYIILEMQFFEEKLISKERNKDMENITLRPVFLWVFLRMMNQMVMD